MIKKVFSTLLMIHAIVFFGFYAKYTFIDSKYEDAFYQLAVNKDATFFDSFTLNSPELMQEKIKNGNASSSVYDAAKDLSIEFDSLIETDGIQISSIEKQDSLYYRDGFFIAKLSCYKVYFYNVPSVFGYTCLQQKGFDNTVLILNTNA